MIETLLQAILEQVEQPKQDLEHNLRALLNEAVTKMDLVSKDEIERQRTALNNANLRLNDLLKQVEALELRIQNKKMHYNGTKDVFCQNLHSSFARFTRTFG